MLSYHRTTLVSLLMITLRDRQKSRNGWHSSLFAIIITPNVIEMLKNTLTTIKPYCGDKQSNYILYYTGWAKSQFTYVGLNSSVTECSIEIILSGMTYYHHWFEEFVKSKHICVLFFQMKVHFCIYLIVWIVGSSQILLDCVWPFELRFY